MNERLLRWLLMVLAAAMACACSPPEDDGSRLSAEARLSGDTTGYPKAEQPRPMRFPADHGPHPEYKHEWWYVTGQLETEGGRRFGFQFTIFREAVSPQAPDSPSSWATNQLYLAHAALADVRGKRYYSDERFARGALGLAGAGGSPLRVWLEDWELAGEAGADGALEAKIVTSTADFGFELTIRNTQPPVVHGDQGLSIKGAAGNASYYYSYVRLDAQGRVRIGNESFDTAGEAWLDHEWSSSALQDDQAGWDWFSLQLSNGAELMAFRLRHSDDSERDFYSGTYVAPSGTVRILRDGQIRMEALGYWTSEKTGVRYPERWRINIADIDLAVTTDPWLASQEFSHSFRYWEGAVRVSGMIRGKSIGGSGYVELAGYE